MESLVAWAGAQGHRIEPYGLDLIESLAALARGPLPQWADHIFVGDVMAWSPPFRFDFARTELEYVLPGRRRELVRRLLDEFLVPGGRLISCSYGSATQPEPGVEPIGDLLRSWGYEVAGEAEGADTNGVVFTRVAWVDAGVRA
jgi:hypothetical protein